MLVHPQVVGRFGESDITVVLFYDLFNLVEDVVCKGRGLLSGLGQISYHDGRILSPFGHLVQVYQNLRIALIKVDALREKHRGVAMGVECQHTVVHLMGFAIFLPLADEPLKQWATIFQALGVPLHTYDTFILTALHRLDNAIARLGHHAEFLTGFLYGLMVERVHL